MHFRALSVLATLAVSSLLFAQDLTKKVDYTTKAVSLTQAFSELSKQAGVSLFVQPDLANEIIVLRLKDVSMQDAMQKIADTVGAAWVKKPDGYELDRSPELADKLRQVAINKRTETLKDALAKKIKSIQADQPLSQERIDKLVAQVVQQTTKKQNDGQTWRQTAVIRDSLPDQLAVIRFLSMVDLRAIASVEDNERLVFSNKPTRMQQEVVGDFTQLANSLKEEHNAFLASYRAAKKGDEQSPYFSIVDEDMTAMPDRFVLSVSKEMFGESLRMTLIVFDGSNHAICTADSNLSYSDQMQDMMAQRARLARQTADEKEIAVSPVTKQMLDFIRKTNGAGGSFQEPITGELRTALLHPETADPLSFAASEAFIGIAESRKENLVLYPDDTMFLVAMFGGMEGSFKPSLVMQAVSGMGQVIPTTITEADGWMTIAPVDRLETLKSRMDRAAFGEYLRNDAENGYVTIASTAKLAASVKGYQLPILAIFVPMMLSAEAQFGMNNDLTMLKIYSTLNESQIQRLENKQPINMSELSDDQVAMLVHFVFTNSENQNPMLMEKNSTYAESRALTELTEAFPNGFPETVTLTMSSESAKSYFCLIKSNNTTFISSMNVDTMAWYEAQKEHPEIGSPEWHPEIVNVQRGESRTLNFQVNLARDRAVTSSLKEERKVGGGPWTMAQLPDDLKAELAKAKQRYNNMPRPGQEENAPPPPQTAPPHA